MEQSHSAQDLFCVRMPAFLKKGLLVALFASVSTMGLGACSNSAEMSTTAQNPIDRESAYYDLPTDTLREKADQGDSIAQLALGNIYMGVDKELDYSEAMKSFRKAAGQGNADAEEKIGLMYEEGYGVTLDTAEALKWYRSSADHGSSTGQAALGIMYENGRGVDRDTAEALKWYRRSAAQGNPGASFLIKNLSREPTPGAAQSAPPACD